MSPKSVWFFDPIISTAIECELVEIQGDDWYRVRLLVNSSSLRAGEYTSDHKRQFFGTKQDCAKAAIDKIIEKIIGKCQRGDEKDTKMTVLHGFIWTELMLDTKYLKIYGVFGKANCTPYLIATFNNEQDAINSANKLEQTVKDYDAFRTRN